MLISGAVVAHLFATWPIPVTSPHTAAPVDAPACVCSPAVTTREAPEETRWYGGPAVAADAVSFALMLDGASSNQTERLMLGLTGYALGAPLNHLAHGHGLRALDSLGVRALAAGLSTLVILGDVLIGHCDNDVVKCDDPSIKAAVSSVLVLTAMALDDGLLARAPVRASQETSLTPSVAAGPGMAYVSLGGRF